MTATLIAPSPIGRIATPAAAAAPTAAEIQTFQYWMQTQGYCVIENAIDPELIASVRGALDAAIDSDRLRMGVDYDSYRFRDIVHLLINRGAPFVRLLEEGRVLPYIESLLGPTCVLHSYNGIKLMPGRGNNATAVHRDSPRYTMPYQLMTQVLYFIDDFTLSNGATWVLPGGHNAPQRPTDEEFYSRAVQASGRAGSALIFDSSLWHAGGANITDAARRGVTLVYSRAFVKQQIDLPRATDPAIVANASPQLRRLLGFNVRVPISLDEFMLPEDQRLYHGGQG